MVQLVHQFIDASAQRSPDAEALCYQDERLSYLQLFTHMHAAARGLVAANLLRHERAAVYLEKRTEAVVSLFAIAAAGAVFVPVNPLLKPEQVAYILRDCGVKILVTSPERLATLASALQHCPALETVVLVDSAIASTPTAATAYQTLAWKNLLAESTSLPSQNPPGIDRDIAAILYTSGSTGQPKGVVLSHRNLIAGAQSVASYLGNTADDRILAVLPLSFDYGFSQLTTAFYVGATVVLINYLLPRDIVHAVTNERITGLAAVPPLWIQLAQLSWPATTSLRYLTNSGGVMPRATLTQLSAHFPLTQIFLMYGLTEAFRSTFLAPDQLAARPDSIGKAIPNAEVLVLRADGSECDVDEPGELVHRGALVAQGYWNDTEKTAQRFKPLPNSKGVPFPEIAVWSGDKVRRNAEGFLYFIGRDDDMIKVSGYRISPTEIEEVIAEMVSITSLNEGHEIAAFGVPHPVLGQAIVVAIKTSGTDTSSASRNAEALRKACQRSLPAYMVPAHIAIQSENLPRNLNGKIDRGVLKAQFSSLFTPLSSETTSIAK